MNKIEDYIFTDKCPICHSKLIKQSWYYHYSTDKHYTYFYNDPIAVHTFTALYEISFSFNGTYIHFKNKLPLKIDSYINIDWNNLEKLEQRIKTLIIFS